MRGEANWVLEADIESFFDSIDRKRLMEMLRQRVADESFLRLVGKCLHVGVLDGEEYSEPEVGTAQGSMLSPMLGNIYLHHVLDVWFDREVKPRLRGKVSLVRYADDLVIGFERREDAERVMGVLRQRMAEYGLTLHPEKTRLVPFQAANAAAGRQGTWNLRLSRLHALLAEDPEGKLGAGLQNPKSETPEGEASRQRLLSAPPT